MRLIDADELKKAFEITVCIEPMPYAFVKQIIDNAPTVPMQGQELGCEICTNRNIKSKEVCTSPFGECKFFNATPDRSLEVAQKSIELGRSLGRTEERVESKRPHGKWIPVTYRPMTEEEEKELCSEFGVKEGSLEEWEKKVFTCPLPDDGQEILVSHGKYVQEDICSWDEFGCGLENNGDWDGVDAWMPKPEPYMKGGAE